MKDTSKMTVTVHRPNGDMDIWENVDDVQFLSSGMVGLVEQLEDWPEGVDRPITGMYAAGAWTHTTMEYEDEADD